eukprot:4184815-Amphidinium_carterae.1
MEQHFCRPVQSSYDLNLSGTSGSNHVWIHYANGQTCRGIRFGRKNAGNRASGRIRPLCSSV